MSKRNEKGHKVYRLLEEHVNFLVNASDEELANSLDRDGSFEEYKNETIVLLDNAKRHIGKKRFEQAKSKLSTTKGVSFEYNRIPESPKDRRNLLESLLASQNFASGLTLAFRGKSGDLTDEEILSLLENLEKLGLLNGN